MKKITNLSIIFFLLFFYNNTIAQTQPNILWIVCEDISPTLSMYGDSTAKTPNLDTLAAESLIYNNAFAPVGVCAPTRSAIITGMYPTSIGTMHMRTGKDVMSWGRRKYESKIPIVDIQGDSIRQYATVLPAEVKCFTEHLRANGYFCTNNQKTDYQFAAPLTAWDENDKQAHWRKRPKGKPFFSVFNINTTHESQIWKKANLPLTVASEKVPVPPYFLDNEITRKDIARHYSNVELMDQQVGKIINQLKADGLYDETIIFFYSDHGGPLPRQKREIYDSGLHVPFFIKKQRSRSSERTDRMISYIDLAPTVLSLANIPPPEYMEGKAFLGKYKTEPREFVFGSSDRFDGYTDRVRAVRDKRFLYLRNFFPKKIKYKDVRYRKNISMMKDMLKLKDENQLNEIQSIWFGEKDEEELYDCQNDPHNLDNLAYDPRYAEHLQKMRLQLLVHLQNHPDWGQIAEAQMIKIMWPDGIQPIVSVPEIEIKNDKIHLKCLTDGSSIAYCFSNNKEKPDFNAEWQLYTDPIDFSSKKYLHFVAERIGYQMSEISTEKLRK